MQNQIQKKIIQSNKRFSKICDQKNMFFIQGQSSRRLIFRLQKPQQIYVFTITLLCNSTKCVFASHKHSVYAFKYVLCLMLFDVNTSTILSLLCTSLVHQRI